MKIIPAIDLIDGKCVRLTKGDYQQQKTYSSDPLAVAKSFEDHGIKYLHLVDLDGARSKHIVNYKTLESIATHTNLTIDFGGGLKSDEDLRIAFESGANQITGGSVAAKNPNLFGAWLKKYGAEKIILGADCKDRMIATNGWKERTELEVLEFINDYQNKGIKQVICTDISKDGMLAGCAVELYKEILENSKIELIASGGVSSMADLLELQSIGCQGVIIGKAIYENKISLQQLQELC